MALFKIEMRAKVKDSITGFKGTVTGRAEYLTGCRQYLVTPPIKRGEKVYPGGTWLDEDRLLEKPSRKRNDGGPQSNSAPTK